MNKQINSSAETGQFIVLDLFNPDIVNVECNENGETLYFDTEEKAAEHAKDVQDPLVIELPNGGTNMLRSTHVLLSMLFSSPGRNCRMTFRPERRAIFTLTASTSPAGAMTNTMTIR